MRYFKRDKKVVAETVEIKKEEAYTLLNKNWDIDNMDILRKIFANEISFRLSTPHSVIWTMDKDGKVLMAGFYGICF